MDTPPNATCGYRDCTRSGDVLICYWVFEENRCRPFRIGGEQFSCAEHVADVAVEAYGDKLVPDAAVSESLVVVDNRISPNKILVYCLKEDAFMRVSQNRLQKRVYEKLKMKLAVA